MKVEDIERIFKETVRRPENSIHLPFEKHARVGRKYNGKYIYSSKLICKYTPEQVLQQLQEIADEKEDVIIINSPLNRSYQYISIEKLKHTLSPTRYKLNETITINIQSEGEDEEYKVKTSIAYRDNDNNKERVVYETENTDDSFILNHTRRYENNDSCPLLDRFIFSAYQRYIIQGIVENNEKESKNDTENNRLPLSKEGYEDL